ncbi:DEAD-domain-containing protein, partial [Metschnikowia bicuspidata var. bicuspidata NRRL YB-4993]
FKFSLDDFQTTSTTDGWEFRVIEDDKAPKKKDVNLDEILRRKGGLTGLVEGEAEPTAEAESKNATSIGSAEEESNDNSELTGQEADAEAKDDDDELAMDGFGMGFLEDVEDDEAAEDDDEGNDDNEEEEVLDEGADGSDSEKDEDSADAIADFFEKADEAEDPHNTFQSLDLSRPVLKGLSNLGYTKPSPIQASSIPIALMGKDIVAGAVTGSGKTAAYMIPIIERLLFKPTKIASTRVIVLTPTRELAIQVCDVGKKIGRFINNLTFGLAVGGLNLRQQEQQLKTRPDIVVATPGRLIDHIRNSASFSIDNLEILVMDEADRMLEEGFQVELTEILTLIPKHKRQTMLYSATMNTKIQDLIQLSLNKPVRIMIDPPKAAASNLVQEFVRIRKKDTMKPALLYQLLKSCDPQQQSRIVVFVSRKDTAHRLRIILGLLGMKVSELHGSLSQEQRLNNVNDFKNLTVPVLICTDLAARGLDIPKIEMVINYDMPKSHEIYLHRVGRTARAGRDGRSVTLVGEAAADRNIVKAAIKSLESSESQQKAVSRLVDWSEIETVHKVIEDKEALIEEVLEEEKEAKDLLSAEMEMSKAENLLKHGKEIYSKPKRTWFESEADKRKNLALQELSKNKTKLNSKKRKQKEVEKETGRSYKKTKVDRVNTQGKARNSKGGKKKGK